MINVLPQVGDKFILHCIAEPSEGGLVTKVLSIEPATKEKPKSEAEKLQDLLSDVGNDAFCKIMAETIEKHNALHNHGQANLDHLSTGLAQRTPANVESYLRDLVEYIGKQLDK